MDLSQRALKKLMKSFFHSNIELIFEILAPNWEIFKRGVNIEIKVQCFVYQRISLETNIIIEIDTNIIIEIDTNIIIEIDTNI